MLRLILFFSESGTENFFLAFCETDRVKELTELLNVLKINKVSKPYYVVSIFKSLGRLQLEEFALEFLSDISKAGMLSISISESWHCTKGYLSSPLP